MPLYNHENNFGLRGCIMATFLVSRLDAPTKAYLKEARERGDTWGVFVDTGSGNHSDSWWGLSVGFGLVTWAVWACFCESYYMKVPDLPFWPIAMLAMGMVFLATSLQTLWRVRQPDYLGDFRFVDPLFWWHVDANFVVATPIADIRSVTGKHSVKNGNYQCTEVKIGRESFTLGNKYGAERVVRYLQTLIELRQNHGLIEQPAARLGNLACHVAFQQELRPEVVGINISLPFFCERAGWFSPRRALQYSALVLPLLLGLLLAPGFAWHQKDEHLYNQVLERSDTSYKIEALEEYLAQMRSGHGHYGEALVLQDDLSYQQAKESSENGHSPAGLRHYLGDSNNARHRQEALASIAVYYDDAIKRLGEMAAGGDRDPEIFNALVGLLEGLKLAQSPIVNVGFGAALDPLPTSVEARLMERLMEAKFEMVYPELKDIASNNAGKSAICELGETFAPEQVKLRENIIMERFSKALGAVLNADLLELHAADGQSPPQITLAYHIFPAGDFYRYTKDDKLSGLLRSYQMQWSILIKQPTSDKVFEKEFSAKPLNTLNMRRQPDDPEWAPYAVMLYSAFHDLSGRFIASFGLEAPTAPDSFTFSDATGHVKAAETTLFADGSTPSTDYQECIDRVQKQMQRADLQESMDRVCKQMHRAAEYAKEHPLSEEFKSKIGGNWIKQNQDPNGVSEPTTDDSSAPPAEQAQPSEGQ